LGALGQRTLFILGSLETKKSVVDYLFVLIELFFAMGVTAEALRANIDWKSAF